MGNVIDRIPPVGDGHFISENVTPCPAFLLGHPVIRVIRDYDLSIGRRYDGYTITQL